MNLSEINAALSGMDPADVAMGAAFAGVVGTLMAVGAAVLLFATAIGYFKMFKKAGQRGWFAFVPLLREYAIFKMAWTVKAFIISTAFLVVFQICGESENILVSLVAVVLGIAWIVMQVKLLLRVAKAFGKGKGWAALLFFLPFVATLILGFGNAEYLGNFETPNVAEESAQIEG